MRATWIQRRASGANQCYWSCGALVCPVRSLTMLWRRRKNVPKLITDIKAAVVSKFGGGLGGWLNISISEQRPVLWRPSQNRHFSRVVKVYKHFSLNARSILKAICFGGHLQFWTLWPCDILTANLESFVHCAVTLKASKPTAEFLPQILLRPAPVDFFFFFSAPVDFYTFNILSHRIMTIDDGPNWLKSRKELRMELFTL